MARKKSETQKELETLRRLLTIRNDGMTPETYAAHYLMMDDPGFIADPQTAENWRTVAHAMYQDMLSLLALARSEADRAEKELRAARLEVERLRRMVPTPDEAGALCECVAVSSESRFSAYFKDNIDKANAYIDRIDAAREGE